MIWFTHEFFTMAITLNLTCIYASYSYFQTSPLLLFLMYHIFMTNLLMTIYIFFLIVNIVFQSTSCSQMLLAITAVFVSPA